MSEAVNFSEVLLMYTGDVSALNGTNYGGLSMVEMVLNAVNGYRANSNSNDYDYPPVTDANYMESLMTQNLTLSW